MILIRRLPSASLESTKNKMRRWQSPPSALPRSTPTISRLRADLPTSNGLRVSNTGTTARLSMARIIRRPRTFSQKHGGKSLAISAQPSSSPFLATKTCVESAKRSCPSRRIFFYQGFGVSARFRQISWHKFYPPTLHHSTTPSPSQSLTRSIKHVPNENQFFSRAHYTLQAKCSRICAANLLRSKNARSNHGGTGSVPSLNFRTTRRSSLQVM